MIKIIIRLLCCLPIALYAADTQTPAHTEHSITLEMKQMLVDGTMPTTSICDWINERVPVLAASKRKPVQDAADLLCKVSQGDIFAINGYRAVPTIVAAVREYHEDFSLSLTQQMKAGMYGAKWFLRKGGTHDQTD